MRLLIWFAFVVSLFSNSLSSAAQASSPAPFLYYYSDFANGVVIERADGTDSRLIGANVMSQELFVAELTWSPSGEWLAWRGEGNDYSSIGGRLSEQLVISSRDGSHLIDSDNFLPMLAADEAATIRFQWMPRNDSLLVERLVDKKNAPSNQLQLYIVDVAHHKITTTYETPIGPAENPADIVWSPDEKYVTVSSASEMFAIWIDGYVTRTQIDNNGSCNPSHIWLPARSSDPFIIQQGNQLIITRKTGAQSVIVNAPTEPFGWVDWSPNAQWALLYPCAGGMATIKLLSMRASRLQLFRRNLRHLDGLMIFKRGHRIAAGLFLSTALVSYKSWILHR